MFPFVGTQKNASVAVHPLHLHLSDLAAGKDVRHLHPARLLSVKEVALKDGFDGPNPGDTKCEPPFWGKRLIMLLKISKYGAFLFVFLNHFLQYSFE